MAVPFVRSMVGRFLGNTIGEAAAFAAGVAIGPVLAPATEALRQKAWGAYQTRIPSAAELAAGVSQGQVSSQQAFSWANANGFGDTAFQTMIDIANTGPDVATAMQAWRRGKLTQQEFATVLRRHAIETQWDAAIEALKDAVLDPAELARAIHRGLIPDPGLLQGKLPGSVGNVPAYPVYPINADQEALASGIDHSRLGVLVGLQGNPMGAHEAAQALFRNVLTYDDFLRAIAEGNTRNEWADAIMEQSRQIPTTHEFVENALRGYTTLAEALVGAARHGMSAADATLIYQNQGRPMNLHAITQALARGGTFQPEPGEITDPYLASIVEGNLKPAYYDLAHANRYTLPSTFAMRQLAQSGVWDQAKTALRLKQSGWLPADADEVAIAWTTAGAAKADPYIAKAEGQLWTQIHKSYAQKQTIDRPRTDTELTTLVPVAADRTTILDLWTQERALASLG